MLKVGVLRPINMSVLVLAAVKFEFEAANAVNVTVPAPVAVITPVDKLTVAEPLPTVLTL